MLHLFTAFLSGLLFGLGLILSGMVNPAKVIQFLDVTGHWDPSLILVMVGAISVSYFAFRKARIIKHTFLGQSLALPTATQIDLRLLSGAALFGIGWGIAGFCPGPALVSLVYGQIPSLVFVICMLLGMLIHDKMMPQK